MIKIFISHSSKDVELIGKLINLFRDALNISPKEIRCTSVDGYRLPAGANTDEQLRREVYESEAFIGVISPSSLKSLYVVFELGARWGAGKHLIPLLAPSMSASALKGPLTSINALSCSSNAQVHQLVSDLAAHLNLQLESPALYQKHIDEILNTEIDSIDAESSVEDFQESNSISSPSPDSNNFHEAGKIIKHYCEKEWPDNFRMRVHCQEQQSQALAELKRGAPSDIPSEIFAQIRAKCASDWPENYKMRLHCEKQQISAYRKLKSEAE